MRTLINTPERRMDGKRFTVGVWIKEFTYKDFYESDKLGSAQLQAEDKHKETGNVCIIFDRQENMIIQQIGEPPKIVKENKIEEPVKSVKLPKKKAKK